MVTHFITIQHTGLNGYLNGNMDVSRNDMKKLLFILLLAIACIGCVPKTQKHDDLKESIWNHIESNRSEDVKYNKMTIDGHEYIVFTSSQNGYPGGIFVIHSESCSCKYLK